MNKEQNPTGYYYDRKLNDLPALVGMAILHHDLAAVRLAVKNNQSSSQKDKLIPEKLGLLATSMKLNYEPPTKEILASSPPIEIGGQEFLDLPLRYMEIALSLGLDPNYKNSEGRSLLTRAVSRENVELAKLLIERGANVNPSHLMQPLEKALRNDNAQLIDLLLSNGAKPNKGIPRNWFLALNSKDETLLPRLIECGAQVNIRYGPQQETALHWCLDADSLGTLDPKRFSIVLKVLVENGLDIFAKNTNGETARDVALKRQKMNLVPVIDAYIAELDAAQIDMRTVSAGPSRASPRL